MNSAKLHNWMITAAEDQKSLTHGLLDDLLSRPCVPSRVSNVGPVEVEWSEIDPGVIFLISSGGSPEDRYLAESIIATRLAQHGYERAEFTFDRQHKLADWNDIMMKAKRLINSGNVTILRNGFNNIVADVKGDHGEYQTEIGRDDPNSRAITTWQCDCPWDQFAWQRTRQWKKYEGRPCAHVLATFWQAQSTPIDEEVDPSQIPPGQKGFAPQTPGDITQLPLGLPAAPPSGVPAPAPSAGPDILPPFPGEQMQLFPPGTTPVQSPPPPGTTVSEPGARQPTPFNPIQNPSTYSKVAAEFNNSDMVRIEEDEWGVAVGKSDAHGNGRPTLIPKGSIGEVMGQDPTTGWVDVIFAGPQAEAGKLEPYHVQAFLEPRQLTPMPNVKKPGPFVKRR